MNTFGERLTTERQDRGLSIQAVAGILGVDEEPLRALERNDFAALPDEAIMTRCLREYAACLEVDAELMIEDYARERARCLRRLADAVTAVPSDTEIRPPLPRWLAAPVILVAIAILALWWMLTP